MRTLCLVFLLLVSCRSLPEKTEQPPESHAEPPAPGTRLALLEEAVVSRHEATSDGFLPITRNGDHLQWLLALIDSAEDTLDLQYYFWGRGPPGTIVLERILQAADRGVRVRMIIDDFQIVGKDKNLASVNLHPNVEVRIFNPWKTRSKFVRAFEYGFSDRIKMRMHNKLIVADNRFCLVGGRNVAAEYYGLSNEFNFQDMGLLACGPIARKASDKFDLYWNAPKIYPAALLSKHASLEYLEERQVVFREAVATAPVLDRSGAGRRTNC
jgi:putative cardiolipin synthase